MSIPGSGRAGSRAASAPSSPSPSGIAKRPELLVLDEPVASLDPLARREFLQDLMEAVAEHELSVVLSSHLVSDLERVCDHLIVLVDSRVQVAGDIDKLLATHHRLTGARRDPETLPADQQVITASHTDRQTSLLVRTEAPILDPAWAVAALSLEDLVLAYMSGSKTVDREPPRGSGGAPMIWLTWRQFRVQAVVVYAALLGCRRARADRRPQLVDAYRDSAATFLDQIALDRSDQTLYAVGVAVAYVVPAVIGAFWGAPMVARELEAGTHRLVWTQSITRNRWLATKLGLGMLGAAAAGAVVGLAMTWWSRPIDSAVNARPAPTAPSSTGSDRAGEMFGARGIAPIGYAAFAFALGVLAGARSGVPCRRWPSRWWSMC